MNVTNADISAALGISQQAVRKRTGQPGWPDPLGRVKPGGNIYDLNACPFPPADKRKIVAFKALRAAGPCCPLESPPEELPLDEEDREHLWEYFDRKPEKQKAEARRKLAAVQAVAALVESGIGKMEALATVGAQIGVHPLTLNRWLTKATSVDRSDRLAALVGGYVGRVTKAEVSVEAWDYFKADYLRREQPTETACYERLERAAGKHGWQYPSLKTLMRKLRREIHPDLIILKREGADALKKTMPAQERDRSVFHALEAVNGDGYTFFKYVRFESGEVCQPHCWFWQDIYAGKLLSYRLDVSENKDMIRLSIGDLIERFGIPEHFWIDNTRAAANKDVTGGVKNRYRFKVNPEEPLGLIPLLSAQVHWATPGHGQAKPIERAFGIGGIGEYVDKHPQFSGRGTKKNPLPIEEFEQMVAAESAAFNARLGRRSKICAGRSYDMVFAESYEKSVIRKATAKQRAMWLLAPEPTMAARTDGSIKILGNRYWSEQLSHHKGQKVVARFDPANLHGDVLVYTLDGRFICQAPCHIAAGFNDRDAARDVAKINARRRKMLKNMAQDELRLTALQAAKLLPAEQPKPEPPKTKVVAGVFEKPQRAVNQDFEEDPAERYNFTATVMAGLERQRKNRL